MYKLQVTADKLNKRTTPSADPKYINWAGDMSAGDIFYAVEVVEGEKVDGSVNWYKDDSNNFISEAWAADVTNFQDWMIDLRLAGIWKRYNERGSKAKVAVLDSGYNINNTEIVPIDSNNSVGNGTTINDSLGHGSCCASLIGAKNINYYVGCAPDTELYIAKITEGGSWKADKVRDAVNWAIQKKVDIISFSQGGGLQNDIITQAVADAVITNNILFIASIGDNFPENGQAGGLYPALDANTLSVGATNDRNQLSKVTMVNSATNINAPGEGVKAYLNGLTPEQLPNGTSQACAIVAGVCALLISQYKSLNKPWSPKIIKDFILRNSDEVVGSPGQKLLSPQKLFSNI